MAIIPLTAAELRDGKMSRIFVAKNGHEPFEASKVRARQFRLEVLSLAYRGAGFFPTSKRWRWEYLLSVMAYWGRAEVLEERGGGPKPTPDEEKRRILEEWDAVEGIELQENFAVRMGISPRTLRRWMKDETGDN